MKKHIYPILLLFIFAIILPSAAPAQLISLKTIPVATGEQFLVYPSQTLGMGGVSIAIDDTLLDPFINPAKGARVTGMYLFSAPIYSRVARGLGALRTLPVGTLFSTGDWFGGLSLAIQQTDASPPRTTTFLRGARPSPQRLSEKSANNTYISGYMGKRLSNSNFSVAGSIHWSGLDALDGVEQLYPGSQNIEQYGSMADLRAGLLGEWKNGRMFEALLLYNRFTMTHDVTYPGVPPMERNRDRTRAWGFHTGYVLPVLQDRARLGGILTINRKSHPQLPNYGLMNILGDPGHSWASNIGLGFSRTHGHATVGMDLIVEPVWTHTWAKAAGPVTTRRGYIIPTGGKTVDNRFRFLNSTLRFGLRGEDDWHGAQAGVQFKSNWYTLNQKDLVTGSQRTQKEFWGELTFTGGLTLKLNGFHLRYHGGLTMGTGQAGVGSTSFTSRSGGFQIAGGDFIPAPSGPLTIQYTYVVTHQLTVSIPIRRQ